MRLPRAAALGLALASLACVPVSAQTERLPVRSRAERQVNDLNAAMARQQQQLQATQQNQFEVNQLRQDLGRDAVSSPAPLALPGGRICPPGAGGC